LSEYAIARYKYNYNVKIQQTRLCAKKSPFFLFFCHNAAAGKKKCKKGGVLECVVENSFLQEIYLK
jgi:hypothetical protein